MFLENWKDRPYWGIKPLDFDPEAEVLFSDDARPRVTCPPERSLPQPEPLEIDAAGLLAMSDVSVRYVRTAAEAEHVVRSLLGESGHFGLDCQAASVREPPSGRSQSAFIENPTTSVIYWRSRSLRFRFVRRANASPAASVRETVGCAQRHL